MAKTGVGKGGGGRGGLARLGGRGRAQGRKSKSDRLAVLEEAGPSWGSWSFSVLSLLVGTAVVWYQGIMKKKYY